jgi:phage tail-like protein
VSAARRGWLLEQLPRPLAEDEFTNGFVSIFEDIAGSVRNRVTGFDAYLDPGLAPLDFAQWLGRWFGLPLTSPLSERRLRALVRTGGLLFAWRGTKRGLAGLLEAVTGGEVEIVDGGGVFPEGTASGNDGRISITLSTTGELSEDDIRSLIALDVPANASVELRLARHEAAAGDESPAPLDRNQPRENEPPEDSR